MTKTGIYKIFAAFAVITVLSFGALAQGKHGGGKGGGKGHGKGNGGGRGHEMRAQRGNDDRGGRGNGNGWGRQKHDDGGQQRAWQQMRQQQEWARGQQRQQEKYAREQQKQNERYAREQQRQNEWNIRRQRDQYEAQQRAYRREWEDRHDDRKGKGNERHLGWYKNGKAYTDDGRPYASTRDWRYSDDRRDRRFDDRRDRRYDDRDRIYRTRNSYTYYNYSDPVVNYLPTYQRNDYRSYGSTRENIVRSLIGSFFGPHDVYYQPYQAYQSYQPYRSYPAGDPYYGGNQQPYYQTASYSPSYGTYPAYGYDSNYGYGYDPYSSYGFDPYQGTQMFGGGGLKSTLLNVGLSLLQGFLGNGYQQGLDQGEYVLDEYGRPVNNYYDPYSAPEPAYYSPLASSFADQRQILQEGYRLGYRDAMMQNDAYGDNVENAPVNLVSQFLANTLISRI